MVVHTGHLIHVRAQEIATVLNLRKSILADPVLVPRARVCVRINFLADVAH